MNRHCRRDRYVLRDSRRGLISKTRRPVLERSLEHVVTGLAHDINNMMHISVGAIKLIQGSLDKSKLEEISELAEVALMSLKRASSMTDSFLSFAKPAATNATHVCVSATVESMTPLLRCMLGDEIELDLVLAEEIPGVTCDRQQLERAILNLAINARDAMPLGGLLVVTTFVIERAAKYLGSSHHRRVGIRMADTGEGMPPDVLKSSFDPFYTTKPHGTGLGLAIVREFVELFGGKIYAQSKVGRGTTMELYFPAA